MRGEDDLAGTSLWEVARESREVNLRENVSLTSKFVNLQLEVTGHDGVLETVRVPLQRACFFMSRFLLTWRVVGRRVQGWSSARREGGLLGTGGKIKKRLGGRGRWGASTFVQ